MYKTRQAASRVSLKIKREKVKTNQLTIFSILLAIVIEVMGMGLFMPLLPNLFWNASSPLLSPDTSYFWRQMAYGMSFGFWAIGIFFGAPFLGDVSDRIGRKKVLVISLLCVMLSYFLSYFSLVLGSCTLFMVSRFTSGFFASSFPIAQAIIVDTSPEKLRARNLGWVTLAASIGIVIGPFLSGISYQIGGNAYGAQIAFLLATVLALLNSISVACLLKETMTVRSSRPIRLLNVVSSCRFAFTDKRIRYLTFIFFILSTLWACYFQGISVLLSEHFKQGPVAISWFYTLCGAGFFIMTVFIQPNLLKRFPLKGLGMAGMIGMVIFFGAGLVFPKLTTQWIGVFFGCMAECLCYTVLMTLFSQQVSSDEQGRVMGGVGATFGLTWGVISPLIGVLLGVDIFLPIILSVLFAVFGFFLMMQLKPKTPEAI